MNQYEIFYSDKAVQNLSELRRAIVHKYKAPITAFGYVQGLVDRIKELFKTAHIYTVQTGKSLSRYGANVRRMNYEKMAIIYTIHHNRVYIHRIVATSLIRDVK